MDISERYIKMCEKAQEIQGFREKGEVNGDIFYLIFNTVKNTFKVKKYKEYADFKAGDVTESGAKCISFNEETQMLEFEYLSKEKEDQIFVFSDNRNEFLDENSLCYEYPSDGISDSLDLKKIWLPRQDQLQEMMYISKGGKHVLISMLESFYKWFNNEAVYKQGLLGFEQLWLAFVMKEKYNKIWNEEEQDWIKS
jgi:hypothetical protein